MIPLIHLQELEIKEIASSASFLVIYLKFDTNGELSTRLWIWQKRRVQFAISLILHLNHLKFVDKKLIPNPILVWFSLNLHRKKMFVVFYSYFQIIFWSTKFKYSLFRHNKQLTKRKTTNQIGGYSYNNLLRIVVRIDTAYKQCVCCLIGMFLKCCINVLCHINSLLRRVFSTHINLVVSVSWGRSLFSSAALEFIPGFFFVLRVF
jgi:hypothetical protein